MMKVIFVVVKYMSEVYRNVEQMSMRQRSTKNKENTMSRAEIIFQSSTTQALDVWTPLFPVDPPISTKLNFTKLIFFH